MKKARKMLSLMAALIIFTSTALVSYADFNKVETRVSGQTKMTKVEISSSGRKAFLSSGYGIFVMEADDTITNYTEGNSRLSNNFPKAAAWDASGNLWIGTNYGLDVLMTDGTWGHIDSYNSNLYRDEIRAIAIDSAGNPWVGFDGYGIGYRNSEGIWTRINSFASGLPSNDVKDLEFDSSGNLWVATWYKTGQDGGVGVLRTDGTWTTYNENSGLINDKVNEIGMDLSGTLWVGTEGGISTIRSDGTVKEYKESETGIDFGKVTSVDFDSAGNPYFGTSGNTINTGVGPTVGADGSVLYWSTESGIVYLKNGVWTTIREGTDSLPTNFVNDIAFDGDELYIALADGIYRNDLDAYIELDPNSVEIVYRNQKVGFDVAPFIDNGTTFVPVRFVVEAMGLTPVWNGSARTVSIYSSAASIVIYVDTKNVSLNGSTMELLAASRIVNGRTMVPIRFVSESLGKGVVWDGDTKTVYIND